MIEREIVYPGLGTLRLVELDGKRYEAHASSPKLCKALSLVGHTDEDKSEAREMRANAREVFAVPLDFTDKEGVPV